LYANSGLRDLESVDGITRQLVLVKVNDVTERRLSEVMRMVDERIESQRQLFSKRDPATSSSTAASLLGGDSPQSPQKRLVVRRPISHTTVDFLLAHAKLDFPVKAAKDLPASPLNNTEVESPSEKHAADAVTEDIIPSSKKRRLEPFSHLSAPTISNPDDYKSPPRETDTLPASLPKKVRYKKPTAAFVMQIRMTRERIYLHPLSKEAMRVVGQISVNVGWVPSAVA